MCLVTGNGGRAYIGHGIRRTGKEKGCILLGYVTMITTMHKVQTWLDGGHGKVKARKAYG